MTPSHLTELGLPGIGKVPYGVHMCSFYRSRDELAAALLPYFAAGLRQNERCVWITARPFSAADARAGLIEAGVDVDAQIERGALVLRDYGDWYAQAGTLKGNQVADLWFAEEERALAAGYNGLRITGNTSFVGPLEWEMFMEYEAIVDHAFRGRRIVTLCTYELNGRGASEILDVTRRHSCTLDRPDAGWQLLTGWADSPG